LDENFYPASHIRFDEVPL